MLMQLKATKKHAPRCPEQGGTGARSMPEQGGTGISVMPEQGGTGMSRGVVAAMRSLSLLLIVALLPVATVAAADSVWTMRGEIQGSAQVLDEGDGKVQISFLLPTAQGSLAMHVATGDRKTDHARLLVHRVEVEEGVTSLLHIGRMEVFFGECSADALMQLKSENEGSGGKSENEGSGGKGVGLETEHALTLIKTDAACGEKSENEGSG